MSRKCNFLFIITHDTGRHLGCYGRGVETPNLDALASQGILFENAFCTAPQCSPSRASILSGKWPHNHGLIGLTHRGFRLAPGQALLPQILASAGYETHLFGFQHEAPDPAELGYRHNHQDKGGRSCTLVAPMVETFLRSRPAEPFYASAGFSETHRPYPQSDAPLDSIRPLPYLPDHPSVRQDVADLEVLVRRVDGAVGNILRALDESGLSDRTVVFFTTDHGIAFPRAKATLFDPGIETALIMRVPGRNWAGVKITQPVVNTDIMPTILELAGVPAPDGVQGASAIPLIEGRRNSLHDVLFFEQTYHAAYDPMRAVRTAEYKYIRSYMERPFALPPNVDAGHAKELVKELGWFSTRRPREQLYDLRRDPFEQRNLATDPSYRDVLEDMRVRLDRWMKETRDPLAAGRMPPPGRVRVTPASAYKPEDDVTEVGPDSILA